MENPRINQLNEDYQYLKQFSKVLSWNRGLARLPNFQPLFYTPLAPFSLGSEIPYTRSVFSTMICSNKVFNESVDGDLYLKRAEIISWFENNAVDDLHLYGLGWHKPPHEKTLWGKAMRSLQRLKAKLTQTPCFRTWRGPLPSKRDALTEAWFCFCYENTSSLPGYITEKILDALAVGCIPVYLGAPDVADHIPSSIFVDARRFTSIDAIVSHMRSLSVPSRIAMLRDGHSFIKESKQFSFEANIHTIVNSILSSLHPSQT